MSHALEGPVPAPRTGAPARSLLPREHGAWAQLLFPVGTALVLGRFCPAGLLFALAAVAVFFTHEPALVLLGHRGTRARSEASRRARRVLIVASLIALLAGLGGLLLAPMDARLATLVPGTLGLLLAALVGRQIEKTTGGEVVAALAFSSTVLPIALAGGASFETALVLASVWAAAFVTVTLAVRAVLARAKRRPVQGLVAGATAVGLGSIVLALVVSIAHPLAIDAALALTPAVLPAIVLAWAPPHARRIRQIGWSLVVSCSLVAAFAVRLSLAHG